MTKNTDTKDLQLSSALGSIKGNIFEQIVEHFPDIIHSVDAKGVIVSTNAFASELLGYAEDELVGKSIYDIYPKEIGAKVKKGFEQLKKEGFKDGIESKLISKTGEIIDVEIRSLSLYDDDGKFIRTFSIIRDMRQINFLKGQLIQQSKLAAIGELAAGIMHDVRNPLTVINSYNNSFLKGAIESGDTKLMLKCQAAVQKAAERIQRLSDHMRNFSRSETEPLVEIDLDELLNDCLLMLETKIKYTGANFKNGVKGQEIKFFCHPNRLEQVIINLLSNACDAIESSRTKFVIIGAEEHGNNITIKIADSGPGISEENKPKIFESFFTTKPKGKGTGLGLSISQGIIYELGGAITLTSQEGEGAEFTISIPKRSK
ncbi:ATP-binding protein [bacterium]|nr:ATP-binding protein [bacterium]